jgi:hypothetical protein
MLSRPQGSIQLAGERLTMGGVMITNPFFFDFLVLLQSTLGWSFRPT